MVRIILFLVLIALAAVGAAWVADQTGDVALSWGGWRAETSLPVFALCLGVVIISATGARPPCHHPWAACDRPWRFCYCSRPR
jgi:HemY protein